MTKKIIAFFLFLTITYGINIVQAKSIVPETPKLSVLMFHSINSVPKKWNITLRNESTSTTKFEDILKKLKKEWYSSINLQQLNDWTYDKKSVLLTFDDWFADFSWIAVPLMEKYWFKWVSWVITWNIGKANYMTEKDIKTVVSKWFDVVSHSVSHNEMNKLSKEKQIIELTDSRKVLEKLTGKKVNTFIYPVGRYNDTTLWILKDLWYKLAFTTQKWKYIQGNSKFEIKRIRVDNRNNIDFLIENIKYY